MITPKQYVERAGTLRLASGAVISGARLYVMDATADCPEVFYRIGDGPLLVPDDGILAFEVGA